jgi:hypothetical protein
VEVSAARLIEAVVSAERCTVMALIPSSGSGVGDNALYREALAKEKPDLLGCRPSARGRRSEDRYR